MNGTTNIGWQVASYVEAASFDSIRRAFAGLIEWDAARRRKFAPACEHYGVARVTARQYRAYRRHLGRLR